MYYAKQIICILLLHIHYETDRRSFRFSFWFTFHSEFSLSISNFFNISAKLCKSHTRKNCFSILLNIWLRSNDDVSSVPYNVLDDVSLTKTRSHRKRKPNYILFSGVRLTSYNILHSVKETCEDE